MRFSPPCSVTIASEQIDLQYLALWNYPYGVMQCADFKVYVPEQILCKILVGTPYRVTDLSINEKILATSVSDPDPGPDPFFFFTLPKGAV